MQITRDEARQHLLRGWPVLLNGKQIDPRRRTDGKFREPPTLPDGEYAACRHPAGLTRAGMAAIINGGGGVLINGNVITDVNELPPEGVLAAGDVDLLDKIREKEEEELAALLQRREDTRRRLEDAKSRAAQPQPEPAADEKRVQVLGTPEPPQENPRKKKG